MMANADADGFLLEPPEDGGRRRSVPSVMKRKLGRKGSGRTQRPSTAEDDSSSSGAFRTFFPFRKKTPQGSGTTSKRRRSDTSTGKSEESKSASTSPERQVLTDTDDTPDNAKRALKRAPSVVSLSDSECTLDRSLQESGEFSRDKRARTLSRSGPRGSFRNSARRRLHGDWDENGMWADPAVLPNDPTREHVSWRNTVDKQRLKSLNDKEIKRQEMIYELIQTEKGFFRHLLILKTLFKSTIEEQKLLSPQELNVMFSNLEEIIEINTPVCRELSLLQEKFRGDCVQGLGPLMAKLFGVIQPEAYAVFCAAQKHAVELYHEKNKSFRFAQTLRVIESRMECSRLHFPDFSAKVLQRLSKYPLLLEGILKYTPKLTAFTEERDGIAAALQNAKRFMEVVDNHIRRMADWERIQYLQQHFDFSACIGEHRTLRYLDITASTSRALIREGPLDIVTDHGKKEVHVILLSDVIIFTQIKDTGHLLKCPGKNIDGTPKKPILFLKDTHARQEAAGQKKGIVLINKLDACMYQLRAMHRSAQQSWLSDITKAVEAVANAPARLIFKSRPSRGSSDALLGLMSHVSQILPTSGSSPGLLSSASQRRATSPAAGPAARSAPATQAASPVPGPVETHRILLAAGSGPHRGYGIRLQQDPNMQGLVVSGLVQDSIARNSGISVGDVIVSLQDRNLVNANPVEVEQYINRLQFVTLDILFSHSRDSPSRAVRPSPLRQQGASSPPAGVSTPAAAGAAAATAVSKGPLHPGSPARPKLSPGSVVSVESSDEEAYTGFAGVDTSPGRLQVAAKVEVEVVAAATAEDGDTMSGNFGFDPEDDPVEIARREARRLGDQYLAAASESFQFNPAGTGAPPTDFEEAMDLVAEMEAQQQQDLDHDQGEGGDDEQQADNAEEQGDERLSAAAQEEEQLACKQEYEPGDSQRQEEHQEAQAEVEADGETEARHLADQPSAPTETPADARSDDDELEGAGTNQQPAEDNIAIPNVEITEHHPEETDQAKPEPAIGDNAEPVHEEKEESNIAEAEDVDDDDDDVFVKGGELASQDSNSLHDGADDEQGDGPVTVVIDIGTTEVRIGFAGDDSPFEAFPAVVGTRTTAEGSAVPSYGSELIPAPASDDEFPLPAEVFPQIGVLEFPLRMQAGADHPDYEGVCGLLEYALSEVIPPTHGDMNLFVVDRHALSIKSLLQRRRRVAECAFTASNRVRGTVFSDQAYLSCLGTGRRCALVLQSGDGLTYAMPVIRREDSPDVPEPVLYACTTSTFAGAAVTEQLAQLLRQTNQSCDIEAVTGCDIEDELSLYLVEDIKEKLGYVSLDFTADAQSCNQSSALEASYTLPDGQTLLLSSVRFQCTEPLFNRALSVPGETVVQDLVYSAIEACKPEYRDELWGNIVLSGGNTLFPGFVERLRQELDALEPSRPPHIIALPERRLLPWIGASIFANWPTAQDRFVTQEAHLQVATTDDESEDDEAAESSNVTDSDCDLCADNPYAFDLRNLTGPRYNFHNRNSTAAKIQQLQEAIRLREERAAELLSEAQEMRQQLEALEQMRAEQEQQSSGQGVGADGEQKTERATPSTLVVNVTEVTTASTPVQWCCDQVADWLASVHGHAVATLFRENGISGVDLLDLTADDLRSMQLMDEQLQASLLDSVRTVFATS